MTLIRGFFFLIVQVGFRSQLDLFKVGSFARMTTQLTEATFGALAIIGEVHRWLVTLAHRQNRGPSVHRFASEAHIFGSWISGFCCFLYIQNLKISKF